jgi:hypothetical protein
VFAAPLRNGDRDDLVVIARTEDPQQRSWLIVAFRLEGGKLARAIEPATLYQLTSANVRWIGAELRDVELYLELSGRDGAIEVGGLLTTRVGDHLRDVLALSPVSISRRSGKFAFGEASDAGSGAMNVDGGIEHHGH